MRRKNLTLFVVVLILTLTACQEAVPMAFEDVCQTANDDLKVIIDGYFSLGASVYCSDVSGEARCGLSFNRYPDGQVDFSAEVMEGRRRNQMLPLESGYVEEDLQIKTADGSLVGVGDHVKVTGELLVTEDVCLIYVDKIETITE